MRAAYRGDRVADTAAGRRRGVAAQGEVMVGRATRMVVAVGMRHTEKGRGGKRVLTGLLLLQAAVIQCFI